MSRVDHQVWWLLYAFWLSYAHFSTTSNALSKRCINMEYEVSQTTCAISVTTKVHTLAKHYYMMTPTEYFVPLYWPRFIVYYAIFNETILYIQFNFTHTEHKLKRHKKHFCIDFSIKKKRFCDGTNFFTWLMEIIMLMFDYQLCELPVSFSKLMGLRTLDLFSNRLTQIPDALQHLNNLVRLDVESVR